jgi:hypothetical protein
MNWQDMKASIYCLVSSFTLTWEEEIHEMRNKRNSSHDYSFARNFTRKTQKYNATDSTVVLDNLSIDTKLSSCSECCILSFG